MTDTTLDIGAHDPEGLLPKLEDKLLGKPFEISQLLSFTRLEPTLRPLHLRWSTQPDTPAIFDIWFIGYYPSFRDTTVSQLNAFAANRDGDSYLVVIFQAVGKAWALFSGAKAKIEAEYEKLGLPAPCCVIKFQEADQKKLNEFDVSFVRTKIETQFASNLQLYIIKWTNHFSNNPTQLESAYRLFRLLSVLGCWFEADFYFNSIDFSTLPFWPAAPSFYEIRSELPPDITTGFGIIASCISFEYMVAAATGRWPHFFDLFARCVSIILRHCSRAVEEYFGRNWVQSVTEIVTDRFSRLDDPNNGSLALISMEQVVHLGELKVDFGDPFLKNLPPARADWDLLEGQFYLQWSRTRAFYVDCYTFIPLYARFRLFRLLADKNDVQGALDTVKHSEIPAPSGHANASLFESDLLRIVFEAAPHSTTARLILSARVSP
jgi:hypothetical protein